MATTKKSLIVPLLFVLLFGTIAWKVNSHLNSILKQNENGVSVESFVQNMFNYFNNDDYIGYTKEGRKCKAAIDQNGFKYVPNGCIPITFNRLEITY